MAFELLAAIDLLGGRVVRLRRGDFDDATVYDADPPSVAERFVDDGIRWLHVVDLDGARAGRPIHGEVIAAIGAAVDGRASIEVGGGIRDEAAAARLLANGIDRVVLGTVALRDPDLVARLVDRHGQQRVVVAVDVRDGRAVGEGWRVGSEGREPADAIDALAHAGVTVFEVTAVDRDGTLEGPDLALYRSLVELRRGSIIASGGIRSDADLEAVQDAGCAGAIVGRALLEARLDLAAFREASEP